MVQGESIITRYWGEEIENESVCTSLDRKLSERPVVVANIAALYAYHHLINKMPVKPWHVDIVGEAHPAPVLQAAVGDLSSQPPGLELQHRRDHRDVTAAEIVVVVEMRFYFQQNFLPWRESTPWP